jgi:hypothetical protein
MESVDTFNSLENASMMGRNQECFWFPKPQNLVLSNMFFLKNVVSFKKRRQTFPSLSLSKHWIILDISESVQMKSFTLAILSRSQGVICPFLASAHTSNNQFRSFVKLKDRKQIKRMNLRSTCHKEKRYYSNPI